MVTKTKFENVNSTRDFFIDDHATVTEIVDLLLSEGIPKDDHDTVIFKTFDKQGKFFFLKLKNSYF